MGKKRQRTGVLRRIKPDNGWAWVDWEPSKQGPKICHLYELHRDPGEQPGNRAPRARNDGERNDDQR